MRKISKSSSLIKNIIFVVFLIVIISSTLVKSSFSDTNLSEIKSITIEEENYGEDGTWSIKKSAEWTSNSEVKVTLNVKSVTKKENVNKDIILVVDTSAKISSSKITSLKSGLNDLIGTILSNEDNRVALISFSDTSTIVSEFTNNESTLQELINNLTFNGSRNYNAALKSVQELLKSYTYNSSTELVTLFVTTGYPNVDTPNQVATYQILKSKYSYMTVNAVQYEVGSSIMYELSQISSKQWYADETTISDMLLEAGLSPINYEKFTIKDYVSDYFTLESIDNVSKGTASISDEDSSLLIWDLSSNYITGTEANLTFYIKLKDEYVSMKGYYSASENINIISKLHDADESTLTSEKTPILKNYFDVTYLSNAPSGCSLESTIATKAYFIYDTVTMQDIELSCDGYNFDGWEIVEKDYDSINDQSFVMTAHDITIRGLWTKMGVDTVMDGTVHTKTTLYDTAVSLGSKYTGLVTDTVGNTVTASNVYTYAGDNTTNNVIFGGYCWLIIRTTETMGTKLLYNGVPKNGTCVATGSDAAITYTYWNNTEDTYWDNGVNTLSGVGYMYNTKYTTISKKPNYYTSLVGVTMTMNLSTTYYYADSYTKDGGGKYTLSEPYQVDDVNSLAGVYTLKSTDSSANDYTVLYIISVENGVANYIVISKTLEEHIVTYYYYDSVDTENATETVITNLEWPSKRKSVVGLYACGSTQKCEKPNYVYGVSQKYYYYYKYSAENILYGNNVTYDENTEMYTINDTITITHDNYEELSNYNAKHYTCFNTSGTCENVFYVYYLDTSSNYQYYITLSSGKTVEDAIVEMFSSSDVNQIDSNAKTVIDTWYENNLKSYSEYLEDVVYCNSRTISELGTWDPNGEMNATLSFNSYGLVCQNETDQFSVSNDSAKLTYPIGLITYGETNLLNKRKTGQGYFTMSPLKTNKYTVSLNSYNGSGIWSSTGAYSQYGIRPVISLKHDIEYTSGNGSKNNPFVIDAY